MRDLCFCGRHTGQHFAVTDDIASAPLERHREQRGTAGDCFVFKCAGAAASPGESLDNVYAAATLGNGRSRSMGVALGACSLPQTATPNFEIGPEDREIGMGIHGEPEMRRVRLAPADTDNRCGTLSTTPGLPQTISCKSCGYGRYAGKRSAF